MQNQKTPISNIGKNLDDLKFDDDILFIFFSFHTWYYTCFNAILPNLPTLSLSHRVHKTDLYISLDTTSKAWSMKDPIDNLYLKTEKNMIWERLSREWEDTILWYKLGENICKRYMW